MAYDWAGGHHLRGVTGRWTSGVRGTGLTGGDDPRLTVPGEDFDVGGDYSLSVAFALKRDLSEVEPPLPRIAGTSDYRFQAFRDGLGFVVFDDSGVAAGSHALSRELAEWTHVASVLDRDDGELRVYQDGSLVDTADTGGLGAITSDSPFSVGPERGRLDGRIRIDDLRVFHLAASVGGIHYIQRENVGGLTPSVLMNQHMLEAATVNGVDRFLFASSACIYRQEHDDLNLFSEDQAIPANPHSTYGWAKVLGEVACDAYHTDTDLDTASVRIFNCYGPRESLDPDSSHVIPSLCRKAIEAEDGDAIELFGDGSQQRGFIYVTDLVDGILRAIKAKADGEPINLGNATEAVTINELAETIIDISGKDIAIEHNLSKPTGTDRYAADTTKMEAELNWTPSVPLEEGLRNVYEWAETELNGGDAASGGVEA